jgi:hypothetical protein
MEGEMYKPSPILTMVSHNNETDVDRLLRLEAERRAELMTFITSPDVREAMRVLCKDLIDELKKIEIDAQNHHPG